MASSVQDIYIRVTYLLVPDNLRLQCLCRVIHQKVVVLFLDPDLALWAVTVVLLQCQSDLQVQFVRLDRHLYHHQD